MELLRNVTVLSLEQATVLPYLTYRLAMDGMKVIRLEHPKYGDPNRFIGENVLGEFFEKHLDQTIQSYLAYKSQVDEQFRRWLELGMDWSDIAQKSMTGVGPFRAMFTEKPKDTDSESEDKS